MSLEPRPIATHGLTHLALQVIDPEASLEFYARLFGVREYFRDDDSIQVLGPGEHDVLSFVKSDSPAVAGGISHFGFRLKDPAEMQHALAAVNSVGATILKQGEFVPGSPYLFIADPDGYEIEIWFE